MLPSIINERPHTTLSVFEKCAIDHILGIKIGLYGFGSVFSQDLFEILFVDFLLFFLAA